MLSRLSGPSRPPAGGGKPRRLVILLHGLGADGNDLIGLAPHWARLAARRRVRLAERAVPVRHGALRLSVVQRAGPQRRGGAGAGCGLRRRSSTPSSTRQLAEARSRPERCGPGRVLARHDDVAVCRIAARRAGRRHRRLFRPADRRRIVGTAKSARARRCCWSTAPRTRWFLTSGWPRRRRR